MRFVYLSMLTQASTFTQRDLCKIAFCREKGSGKKLLEWGRTNSSRQTKPPEEEAAKRVKKAFSRYLP